MYCTHYSDKSRAKFLFFYLLRHSERQKYPSDFGGNPKKKTIKVRGNDEFPTFGGLFFLSVYCYRSASDQNRIVNQLDCIPFLCNSHRFLFYMFAWHHDIHGMSMLQMVMLMAWRLDVVYSCSETEGKYVDVLLIRALMQWLLLVLNGKYFWILFYIKCRNRLLRHPKERNFWTL